MPHSIFVPAYDDDGRLITDQRILRIMNEERTPEDDRRAYESLKAKDEAAKAARIQMEQKAREEKEFQAGAQAAAQYGIAPQALRPAGMEGARMLDAEQEMNARFEEKKQELAQKYQGPEAGNMARELNELHQKQDAELAAKFASNPVAEQVIGERIREFRVQTSAWLQGEIQTRQQQYFDAVDQKCNDALAAQLSAMQPEQFGGALVRREQEMRALGRTPEQIGAARQTLLGSYFQNLATSNPSAFLEAVKQPDAAAGAGEPGPSIDQGAGNSNAPSLQNPLTGLAKALPAEQLGKFSRLAERAQVNLEKKEKMAQISMRQQEIMQNLTGLDSEDQRAEIEKITAGLEDRELAETLKTRLHLQLNYEDKVKAAKDWEFGEKILAQDTEPLQKLEMIASANISEAAREALTREVMGDPAPETPENRQAALDTILKIGSGAIQSERQLYAICQQQGLTRGQAALLGDAFAGNGRVNGVPVGMAINALQQRDPALADNPAALLKATKRLLRDWPEGEVTSYRNIMEQAAINAFDAKPVNFPLEGEQFNATLEQLPLNDKGVIPDDAAQEVINFAAESVINSPLFTPIRLYSDYQSRNPLSERNLRDSGKDLEFARTNPDKFDEMTVDQKFRTAYQLQQQAKNGELSPEDKTLYENIIYGTPDERKDHRAGNRIPAEYREAGKEKIDTLLQELYEGETNLTKRVLLCEEEWRSMDKGVREYNLLLIAQFMADEMDAGEVKTIMPAEFPHPLINAAVDITNAEYDSFLGIDRGNFEMSEVVKVVKKALYGNVEFEDCLANVFHELWHKRDAKLADDVFSIVSTRNITPAEREHALLVGLNLIDYKKFEQPGDNYEYQYSEHSAYYFGEKFKEKLKNRHGKGEK